MSLNIPNLDRLISHLEGLPEEKFDMSSVFRRSNGVEVYDLASGVAHECGTAGCIAGWCNVLAGLSTTSSLHASGWIGIPDYLYYSLFMPAGYDTGPFYYPLSRAIRTLKHMRSEYLRTGTVVVDWDAPQPVTKAAWSAPRATERKLPAEIISLLRSAQHSEVSA